jgi:hypothetical protein
MKIKKILNIMLVPMFVMALAIQCTNEDDAITLNMTDVSSRITGFATEKAGTGAAFTVTGSQLDEVERVFVGNQVVPKKAFTNVSDNSITFTVPSAAVTGMDQQLLFVFPGSARAIKKIEVIAFQAVSDFVPKSASEGDSVTILGANLNVVSEVKLGSTSVGFKTKSANVIRFRVPAGASDSPITLASEAGSSNTALSLISCSANPAAADCAPGLNLNSSFELGTGDDFTNWSKWNGGTFLLATTLPGEVYRGDRALKVVRNGSLADGQWRIQLSSDPVATDVGASYTVYLWAKASAVGGSMRVSTNPSALYTADQAVTTSWTRLAFTFPAANETQTRIVLDLNGNNKAVTTFYIDDVKIVKN